MTPERIKHFKRLHIQKHHNCDSYLTVGDFNSLLADLEETQQRLAEEKRWRTAEHEVAAGYHRELVEAQQTIAQKQQMIDAALSWTWNCGEANMLEVIAALKGKEQIVLTYSNCPICNSNNTLAHPNKAGIWLCVPCDKVFEDGETT